ncbi:transport protein Avl9-domain-containing protein [Zychaea mexicana]|uniref:transport protein Avl9-domain-containing protein n=1 Tax=Zychaea mexicana TaxID=64656 RepID=UPI0022FF2F93|nr:transport protein Avl9-domain-containing protein [Zychaea mexicana]KAI9488955.1 transport protein Avl9-domain-containing protein [Zychaea mexicana]
MEINSNDNNPSNTKNTSSDNNSNSVPSVKQPPEDDSFIAALLVVGFHHAHGPIVEFCVPPLPQQDNNTQQTTLEKLKVPEEWNFLPFLALPDGAHQKDEDFAYFHLPPVPGWPVAETTLFGISCNRQIAAKDLLVKTPDVTRSIVQKAVVVLARQPIFGPLRQKLAVITSAWFNQKDFTQLDILYDFYRNLQSTYRGPIDDSTLYMGTSLRELLHKFKSKTLMLLKLLLLEKRILFYGYPVERLCTFEYSLMSLVPGLLRSLQDSGDPDLDTSKKFLRTTEAKELSSGNKESLLKFMGLPLRLFEKGSFFQPYLPLQQIDILSSEKTKSYVIGTTNQIFFHHKSDINIDVLVNVETGSLEFHNQRLSAMVGPTMADRRWMENIVRVVNDTWDESDPSRPMQNTYLGSDDYLRARFEEYILSLLSSMKHAQDANLIPDGWCHSYLHTMHSIMTEKNYLSDYGMSWLMAWRETNNFTLWNQYTDHEIYEIVEPGHPGMGNISISDIQNTLSNRLRDLQLRQNLAPLRQTLSRAVSGGAKAMSTGRSRLFRGMDALWNEFERGANDEAPRRSSADTANPNASGKNQERELLNRKKA